MILRNFGPPRIYLPSNRRVGTERPDVLLLQGFATGGRAMEWIAEHLTGQGLTCAVPRSRGLLGYLQTVRIPTAAARVATLLRARPSRRRTWLIGHSMGGLIARYVVQHHDTQDAIAGVITLGSPHVGTHAAVAGLAVGLWAVSGAPADVTPRSRLLKQLNDRPWPENVPLTSIYSRSDMLCIHPAGRVPLSAPPGIIQHTEIPHLGHTQLLWKEEVLRAISDTISSHSERGESSVSTPHPKEAP